MPIQSDDIKLLRSAVMADVPEGGGAMTGVEVVDGHSNNIFPDTSTDDRAAGRVNFRKLFGVAHTNDTDTLLGASFVVLEPPEDPLVHVTLFETPGWADERTTARELVERYLVKGPRMSSRIMDTHYAGSLLLQLYQVGGANFPASGDAIVLRNPNDQEQYVRIIKVTQSSGNFNAVEGGGVVAFAANVAVCELGQPLQFDVLGPPVARAFSEDSFAQAFVTTVASGTAFYGVKPLAAAASVGDRSVFASGGIFSPLVPAATVESAIIDQHPLLDAPALSPTAFADVVVARDATIFAGGTVLTLPTQITPGSLRLSHGSTPFLDDARGGLTQGGTLVGTVNYRMGQISLLAGTPSYGTNTNTATYRPATPAGASVHSDHFLVTVANQGLVFTTVLEPLPAPNSLTLHYLAQGRWYTLQDDGTGRLQGADPSHGVGTVNYSTGSLAMTLGALPDVGSPVIAQWGDGLSAQPITTGLPTRVSAVVPLSPATRPDTLAVSWLDGAAPRSAVGTLAGDLIGQAPIAGQLVGRYAAGQLEFFPPVLPTGGITVASDRFTEQTAITITGLTATLSAAPLQPGTASVVVALVAEEGVNTLLGGTARLVDNGAGVLTFNGLARGTINYATGAVTVQPSLTNQAWVTTNHVRTRWFARDRRWQTVSYEAARSVGVSAIVGASYAGGAAFAESLLHTPAFGLRVVSGEAGTIAVSGTAFTLGGTLYTAQGGQLRTAWNTLAGSGTAAGTIDSTGRVTLTALAPGTANTVVWSNAARDLSVRMVSSGVFRLTTAPVKVGVFQMLLGNGQTATADAAGTITGAGITGAVDYARGWVQWSRTETFTSGPWLTYVSGGSSGDGAAAAAAAASVPVPQYAASLINASLLSYNAVELQYLPLDGTLLGLETARLPLDGKAPIYRAGGQLLVHNTLTTALPNPLTKGTAYALGRQRVAAVRVRTLAGQRVPGALYTTDFNLGTITFPVASDLTGLAQPFTVEHRIEDELMMLRADISGRLDLVAGLTHNYPAGTSYLSSKLRKGDLFARAFGHTEQTTWTGLWSDTLIGGAPTASYNRTDFPIAVTNRGAITERWAVIFTGTTQVRVVGEEVGQILTSVSINADIAPLNPQTGAPYFSIPALGWGGGWSAGNVLRFNTAAAGGPVWVARTVLQGPATVASDSATIAFRADVDA